MQSEDKHLVVAGLYARVSTSRQEEQATIDSQIEEIKRRIEKDGNVLSPENTFLDDGWSGSELARPALDELRDVIKRKGIGILYVYDIGRLSRDFTHQLLLIKEIEEAGVKFISLHDINPENEEQNFIRNILGSFHAYERVKIAERFRRGKLFKARNGILINGSAVYGYNYVKKTDKEPAHYEINDEEARVVRMIYQWFAIERISFREIIKRLYDKRIPPRKRKSEFWTKGPIVRMLQRNTYAKGFAYYNKGEAVVAKNPTKIEKYKKIKRSSRRARPREDWIPFRVPPIIEDNGIFENVQKILIYNQKYACKKRKYSYLLSGLVSCECGSPRVGDGADGRNFYYRCAERIYRFPLEKKCKLQGMNAGVLDQTLWKELMRFLQHPTQLRKHAEEWLKLQSNNESDKQEKDRLVSIISKISDEEARFTKAYGEGALDFEQFKELIRAAKKNKLSLQEDLNILNQKIAQQEVDTIQLDELVEEAKRVIKKLELANKFQVVRDIIDRCIVKGGNTVEVRGHLNLSTVNMGYEPISRNCGFAKCGEEYSFQCASEKAAGFGGELSLCHHRTKCGSRASSGRATGQTR